jgi:hypothetical protein
MTMSSIKEHEIYELFETNTICDLLSNNTPSLSNIYNFVPIVIGSTKEIGAIINVIGISYCDLDLCLFYVM